MTAIRWRSGPMGDDPFVQFFNREYEIGLLARYLANGACCQIVGPPGIGKSTLIERIVTCRTSPWDGYVFAVLRGADVHTAAQLVRKAGTAWGISAIPTTTAELSVAIESARTDARRRVLVLDDFESITSNQSEFTTEFFLDLRAIAQKGVLMLTTSRAPLSTLLPPGGPVSPFFALFAVIRLGPFESEVASQFLESFAHSTGAFSATELDAIRAFGKNQPGRLMLAGSSILEGRSVGMTTADSLRHAEDQLAAC